MVLPAKQKGVYQMAFETGPYVQVACFCESVLREDTGVVSLIRIIDTLTSSVRDANPPGEMPPVTYNLNLALMLKSGTAQGRSTLKIVPESPSAETSDPIIITVHFEGEEKGHVTIVRLNYTFTLEGLYMFNVYVDETKLTSIPLRVKYNRVIVRRS